MSGAASVNIVPVSGNGWNEIISIPDTQLQRQVANFNRVSPDYFRTMGTPLLAGRDFTLADSLTSPRIAIVTETFSRKFLAGANPVGHVFELNESVVTGGAPQKRLYQIAGLVKDTKYTDLREEFSPLVYLPAAQDNDPVLYAQFVIRSDEGFLPLVSAVKREIGSVNPAIVLEFSVFSNDT